MRLIVSYILIGISLNSFGQTRIEGIVDSKIVLPNSEWEKTHSVIQPAIRKANTPQQAYRERALKNGMDASTYDSLVEIMIVEPIPEYYRKYALQPLVDAFAQLDTVFNYRSSIGFTFEKSTKKWYNRTSYSGGWSTREGMDQTHPGFLPLHERPAYFYHDIRTRFGFTPNNMLHLSAGIDNQFFGEGYRSLLQSNQVAPNPFAMMRVNFWRFEYGLLYQFYHEQTIERRNWKFNATHYLSFNATKNWNITLFENVLFQPKDSSFNRGFEVEYLNPIAFFRPQEYSIGSSDNVLLGLNSSYKRKHYQLYFQLSLDEFVLNEIKARSKWWANKYGVQLGIKGQHKSMFYRIEGNLVRPYTYAHINSGQNAGNLGRPIGHPLGSNFAELLGTFEFTLLRIRMQTFTSFVLKGLDETGKSWGGDVYESYVYRPKEYDNTIGQGITVRTFSIGLQCSRKISPFDMIGFIALRGDMHWGEIETSLLGTCMIGMRTNLFQERRWF